MIINGIKLEMFCLIITQNAAARCLQEQYKRTLLLPKGKVTVASLLELQQHNPPEHLRLEIEPLARCGADKVTPSLQSHQNGFHTSCPVCLCSWPYCNGCAAMLCM